MTRSLFTALGLTLVVGCASASADRKGTHACQGISATDRDRHAALLDGRDPRVEHAHPLKRTTHIGKATMERSAGVRLYVRAEPGLSQPLLQRHVDCAIGHRVALAQPGDPYAAHDVRASVRPAGHHFVVELETPSADAGRALESHVLSSR